MAKIRLHFTKEDPVRYISHLDILRTFERAIRRAGIRMLYSEGFHPKPKLSFASALSVGVTSSAEYVDLEVEPGQRVEAVADSLDRALPPGMNIIQAIAVEDSAPALMAVVNTASYAITLPDNHGLDEGRVHDLLQQEEISVERESKKKRRMVNIRPWIYRLELIENTLHLDAASGSQGNLRVDEVLKVLQLDGVPVTIQRIGLWIASEQGYQDPLTGGIKP